MMQAESNSVPHEENFWTHMYWRDLVDEHPNVAFDLVLEILARDQSRLVMQYLSAGPLEELLGQHGEQLIGRFEEEARRSPNFRKLLGGIWQGAMAEPIWKRLQEIWDRRGWDGIPE